MVTFTRAAAGPLARMAAAISAAMLAPSSMWTVMALPTTVAVSAPFVPSST